MIWLASFPRSGNTFLRIVLYEVYGIESSTFHHETNYPVDANYAEFPIVKTHLLPDELTPADPSIPAIYLVRDGRDCVVSLAHYRQQLIAEDSDLETDLLEAIDAASGCHFGGWSEHVRRWLPRASLVLRFEDLIADPIACTEQLRPWLDLPEPRTDRLPSFSELRSRDFRYGSGVAHGFDDDHRRRWRTGKFRRGRIGAWMDEMPERLHLRFLRQHGPQLAALNYIQNPDWLIDHQRPLPAVHVSGDEPTKRRVLIDAAKLLDVRMDGIRRYVQELLKGLLPLVEARCDRWNIDVRFGVAGTFSLLDIREDIEQGRPPLSALPSLLHPANSIAACKERLQELKSRISLGWVGETSRYNSLKLLRSLQKRWLACNELRSRVSGWLRPTVSESSYDLVHLTLPNTWSLYNSVKASRMLTVHDLCHLVCPEFQNAANIRTLASGLRHAEQAGSGYIAVSQSTAEQMMRLLGTAPERIRVVYEGCNSEHFRPGAGREEWSRVQQRYSVPDGPYVLSVGTVEPRKNLIATVRAFRLLLGQRPDLNAHLLIAGGKGWGNADELDKLVSSSPRIRMLGYIEDEDLPILYTNAEAFCYVSRYEGFGLPLLEAMSCGTPTIYGDTSSMPEIADGAGLSAEPENVSQIARRLEELFCDKPLRQRLARHAVLRALDFTWQKTAEQTLDCYEEFIANGGFRDIRSEPRAKAAVEPVAGSHDAGTIGGHRDAA